MLWLLLRGGCGKVSDDTTCDLWPTGQRGDIPLLSGAPDIRRRSIALAVRPLNLSRPAGAHPSPILRPGPPARSGCGPADGAGCWPVVGRGGEAETPNTRYP